MIWMPVADVLTSPLLKIPVLLSTTTLASLAQTPPNPPPDQEESAKYGDKRDPMGFTTPKAIAFYIKTMLWGNFACESAVLLASHFPSETSHSILSVLARNSPEVTWDVRVTPSWLAGCALISCGAILRLVCYRTLGRFFTWELSLKKDHALVTEGPYSVVRHPAYVGNLLIGVGTTLCHFGMGSWYKECIGFDTWGGKLFAATWAGASLAIPVLLMRRVNAEDDVLRREFKGQWEAYANKTPYKLFPFIY